TMDGNIFTSSVGESVLKVNPDRTKEFSAFISAFIVNPSHTFTLRGTVDVKLTVSLAVPIPGSNLGGFSGFIPKPTSSPVTVPGIAFSSEVTLNGFNNFPKIDYIKEVGHSNADDGSFEITSTLNIFNPSQLGVIMGDVYFKTLGGMSQQDIGVTLMKQLELKRGDNLVSVVTSSKNPESAAIYKHIYESGETLSIEGFDKSSETDFILAAGIAPLRSTCKVPALKTFEVSATSQAP
ncbi:hypothetical protein BGZ95_003466, partial [Linnemannia exigua]